MAGAGAAVAVALRRVSHDWLCGLISFAAGALGAVVLLDIIPEAVEQAGRLGGALSVLSGYVLFALITRYVAHICPACSATHQENQFKALTVAMLIALSIHSFMDGLAIYSGSLTPSASAGTLLGVAYHKFPEGLALALVARQSGMSRTGAFAVAAGVEALTTILGSLAGLWVLGSVETVWVACVLGHAGGGFLFIVVHALSSEVTRHHPPQTLLSALAGGLSIALTGALVH